jgi:hypothetical protein
MDLRLPKGTLAQFDLPLVAAEKKENRSEMFDVLLESCAVHQYVVEEDDDTSAQQWL